MKVVLFILFGAALFLSPDGRAQPVEVAPGVLLLGTLQNPNVTESSGVVSSRRLRGAFWTHSDSGAAVLYAFTTNGTPLSEWSVQGVETHDWEDVAWSAGRIFIADIGNNHGTPGDIYLVTEPPPRRSGTLRVLRHWKLKYPDDPFDSESFFISRGAGYLIRKENGKAHVYRVRFAGRFAGQLEEQCSLRTDSAVSGADISRDNRRLAVITDDGAYLFLVPRGIPTEGTLEPAIFVPFSLNGMEGCAFTRDGLLVTAESGEILMFTDPLFRVR